MATLKGPGAAQKHDGSPLRIAIVHARWNSSVIDALVSGAQKSLLASGVRPENIVVQSVPGSYELPLAVQRVYAASQVESSTQGSVSAGDLLSSMSGVDLLGGSTASTTEEGVPPSTKGSVPPSSAAFDAVIAIGVLIKGETMHFEYIADAVSQGLMRVQLDLGVSVVFGLLTVLSEEQAMARAGMDGKGHCHGEDWGNAAVELGVKRRAWGEGKMA
ncbi:hypothetical protein MMC14_004646 [Varicellaria rhodocarpa]|nr:hypothetical protein [Varicellaria rhodocarpa]